MPSDIITDTEKIICRICHHPKPSTDFNPVTYRSGNVGVDRRCRECRHDILKQRSITFRIVHPDRVIEQTREYRDRNREELAAKQRIRRQSRAQLHADYKRLHRDDPKEIARCILRNAVKTGEIAKPKSCQECGQGCITQGHHKDYDKPLDVMWLCSRCHGLQHRINLDALRAFDAGKEG